jgi:hypothetical protein
MRWPISRLAWRQRVHSIHQSSSQLGILGYRRRAYPASLIRLHPLASSRIIQAIVYRILAMPIGLA